jgi:adenosylmethionine-8-amino-7-oxononanoate aminotransferase
MLICGSTNYACPIMLATAKASLEAYETEDIPSKVQKSEKIMAKKLR